MVWWVRRVQMSVCVMALGACGEVRDEHGSGRSDASADDRSPDAAAIARDAGTSPPSYCMPSCIWDAIRDCMPPPAIRCETSRDEATSETLLCDKTAGWTQRTLMGGQAGTSITLEHDGAPCLVMTGGGANPFRGIVYGDRGRTEVSGYLSEDRTQGGCGLPTFDASALEPGRPECKKWTGDDTTHWRPILQCAETVDGDCGKPSDVSPDVTAPAPISLKQTARRTRGARSPRAGPRPPRRSACTPVVGQPRTSMEKRCCPRRRSRARARHPERNAFGSRIVRLPMAGADSTATACPATAASLRARHIPPIEMTTVVVIESAPRSGYV